jgi:hypothetical protein
MARFSLSRQKAIKNGGISIIAPKNAKNGGILKSRHFLL